MEESKSLLLKVESQNVAKATDALDALETQAKRTEKATDSLGDESNRTGRELNQLDRKTTALSGSLSTATGRMAAFRSMARGVGISVVAMGGAIVGAVGAASSLLVADATRDWLEYDKAIKEVASISGDVGTDLRALRGDVLALSSTVGVDAVQATRGLYQALSAGVPRENALSFLETASKTSIAGVTSVDVAVDGLTNTINAFKLDFSEADEVADKLFTTVKLGKTTLEELSTNLSKASVPASGLGVDLDELLAVFISITKQGTPSSEAFTQIRAAITALVDPSNEMAAVYDRLGVSSGRQAVEQFGLAGTLDRVRSAYEGNDAALVKALRSTEAFNGVLSATGQNAGEVATALDELGTASGAMGGAYATNADTLGVALNSLKASIIGVLESMENNLGVVSAFSEALRGVAGLIAEMGGGNLTAATQGAISSGGAIAVGNIQSRITELEGIVGKLDANPDALQAADSTGQGVGRGQALSEIKTLRAELEKLPESAKKLGAVSSEINKLKEELDAGTITAKQFESQRQLIVEVYNQERDAIKRTQVAVEEKSKVEEAAKAERKRAVDEALAASQEEEKQLSKIGDLATDLATTEKDRLQTKLNSIRYGFQQGAIEEETATKAITALEEEIRLLDERNAKKATTSTGGGGGVSTGGGLFGGEGDAFAESLVGLRLADEEEEIQESYNRRKQIILDATFLQESEKTELMERLAEERNQSLAEIDARRREQELGAAEEIFGTLANLSRSENKKLAAIGKAAAVAQATINTYTAATRALSEGGPYSGPILAAAITAVGLANVAQIASTEPRFEFGGIVGGSSPTGDNIKARVNSGEMVLTQGQQARLFEIANGGGGGGGSVNVVVHNPPGSPAAEVDTTRQSDSENGTQVEVFLKAYRADLQKDIATRGPQSRQLESTFKLNR